MELVILWAGNLVLAGVLPLCISAWKRCRGAGSLRRREDAGARGLCLWQGMVWLLEFAVYSAVVIRMSELVLRGVRLEAGGAHSPALSAVMVLCAESMVILFLVLSALKRWQGGGNFTRRGSVPGHGKSAVPEGVPGRSGSAGRGSVPARAGSVGRGSMPVRRNPVPERKSPSAEDLSAGREEVRGETVMALLLLLALALHEFGEDRLWETLLVQLGVLCMLLLIIMWREKRRRKREDREEVSSRQRQEDYQKNIDIQYQRTRELWHDLKNHIGVLEILAREERIGELADYLKSFRRDVESRMIPMKTGNIAVDAILSDKLFHARKGEIEVQMQVCDLSEMTLSPVDLCAVLGNLLDNAIEACGKYPGKRRIALRLWRQEEFWYLTVVNTAPEPVRAGTGFVSEKKGYDNGVGHGLGIRSVERIAHQYGGSVVTEYAEGEFRAVVRLKEETRE